MRQSTTLPRRETPATDSLLAAGILPEKAGLAGWLEAAFAGLETTEPSRAE